MKRENSRKFTRNKSTEGHSGVRQKTENWQTALREQFGSNRFGYRADRNSLGEPILSAPRQRRSETPKMDPPNSKLSDAHAFPATSPVAVVSKPPVPTVPISDGPVPVDHPNPELPDTLKNDTGPPAQVDGSIQVEAPVETVPNHENAPPGDAAQSQPVGQHAVPEHVPDGEAQQHVHEIPDELHHDLQQGEEVAHPGVEPQMTEEGKDGVAVHQHVAQAQDGGHPSEQVQGHAGEVVQAHQQEDGIHAHVQDISMQEVTHEQEQQRMEGVEVQHVQHQPPMQREGDVHSGEHVQGQKMEVEVQQPIQEGAQSLEQEHDNGQAQSNPQEQYQEHIPQEHHSQPQEQLTEQHQLQSQEQLVEHHPEHAQAQVQEQVVDHQQVSQGQDTQGRHDEAVQQQMGPAHSATMAAAAAAATPPDKMGYEQVVEDARYQQQPIATPEDSRPAQTSPTQAVRRGAERYHASGEQLRTLIDAFEQDPTPSVQTLNFLSSSIGMPMHNLVLWFKNRRARHKKTHPNTPLKTGRRSYVKSGIYSRAKKSKQQQEEVAASATLPTSMQQPTHQQLPPGMMLPPDPIDGQAVPDLPQDQQQEVHGSRNEDLVGAKRTPEEQGMVGPTVSKRTKYAGVKELIGEENPCRLWDTSECHRRCVDFFERTSGGRHPEQTSAARVVSAEFFLSELQSGLTLTSAMQPLDTSVAVLDNIMDRLPADGPKLSSGSRVILREFFAQVRSGDAATVQPASLAEEGEEIVERSVAVGDNAQGDNVEEDGGAGDSGAGEHTGNETAAPPAAPPEEQQTQ